jgi:acyl-CoA thioester hydrolase
MSVFEMPLQIRWSDLDPNYHLRHSVYYDWAALCRISFLNEKGLTIPVMQRLQFGPIIFREECIFRKEIKHGDSISINLTLVKGRRDFSRWTIRHEIKKAQPAHEASASVPNAFGTPADKSADKADGTLCAIVTIDGAWLNVVERKLFTPPAEVAEVFQQMPMGDHFEWQD